MDELDTLVAALRKASIKESDAIKAQLLALASGPKGPAVRDYLEMIKRGELLEVQWEIDEVLEATAPPPPPSAAVPEAPKPVEEPPPDPNRQLTSKDLVLVYDDPRGLLLHKAKVGERWFATQFDPRTGQPQTFELQAAEIAQLKTQLAGSPYWVVGAGGITAAPPGAIPKAPVPKPPGR